MGRRKDHTREELKGMAVSIGFDLLRRNGPAKLTTREIAVKMGYAAGTLYNVFGDRDDLVLHINARVLDELEAHLRASIRRTRTQGAARMKALSVAYLDFCFEQPNLWRSLYENASDDVIPEWYLRKVDRIFSIAEEALSHTVRGGPRRVRQAARVLWAGIHGIVSLSAGRKLQVAGVNDARKLCDSLVDNYLKGLARR